MLSFFFLFAGVSQHAVTTTLSNGQKPKLCAGILRGLYVGALSHGTYQATFRTRSIFVMRVDSRARPSDVGRESTTFKAEQRVYNPKRWDESAGQPRSSYAFQRSLFHRGTCWMFTPERRFHWGERRGDHTDARDYRCLLFVFRTFSTLRNCRKTRLSFHTETHREDFSFIGDNNFPITWRAASASFFSSRNKCQHLSTKSLSSIDR